MFAEMDANNDGIVTAAEVEAMKDAKRLDGMSASEHMKMCDHNADGRLTATENATASDVMFDKMDTNRDGSLIGDDDDGYAMFASEGVVLLAQSPLP